MAMVSLVRPGSWTGAEAQDGSPGNLRDPARVHARERRQLGSRLNKCPGLGRSSTDAGALMKRARTSEGSRGARKRTNKRPGMREREVVAPS